MTDERYKELMQQLGMPNSTSLLIVLQQVANEVGQEKEKENAELRLGLIDIRGDLDISNDANVKLAYENDELRAHLANVYKTLKPYFTSGNSIDVERAMIPKSVFDSLPKTAALDAEILRCVDEWYDMMETYAFGQDEPRDEALFNAVRVRNKWKL